MSKTSGPDNPLKENRSDHPTNGPKREGWNAEDLGEQSSYEGPTEMSRRLRRGNETAGDPNERDVAGAVPKEDTPQGREVGRRPSESADENSVEKPG